MPQVLSHLDLTKNQIINVAIHNVATLPTSPVTGQVVVHSNLFKYYNGSIWISMNDPAAILAHIAGGKGAVKRIDGTTHYIDVDTDEVTLTIDPSTNAGKVKIKAGGVGTTELASNAVTTVKVTDRHITFGKIQNIPTMTVIGRVAAGTEVSSAISILNANDMAGANATTLTTSGSIKAYVDGKIAAIGQLQGSFNAGTETQFPANSKKGDYWYVSVAGTVQGIPLNVGDVLIANQDSALRTDPNHWTFLETNRDQSTTTVLGLVMLATQAEARAMTSTTKALTPSNLADVSATNAETQTGTEAKRFVTPASLTSRTATETRTGIAGIATTAEAEAATNDTKIMTPLKVKAYFDSRIGGYAADLGNGTATTFTISHSLNTLDVVTELYQKSNGEKVIADVSRSTVNAVIVSFASAPTSNQYRIVIKK